MNFPHWVSMDAVMTLSANYHSSGPWIATLVDLGLEKPEPKVKVTFCVRQSDRLKTRNISDEDP